MKTPMKNHNPSSPLWTFLIATCLLAAPVFRAQAQIYYWTNSTSNLLWSNPLNWSSNTVPDTLAEARFDMPEGATNVPGNVNSIVDLDITVHNVFFNVTNPYTHTLLINPGVTLTVLAPDLTTSADKFTLRPSSSDNVDSYVTVRGAGRVVVGDTNNLGTTDFMRVHKSGAGASASVLGPYMGTMDLSGLDYFAFALGNLRVGASASGATSGTRGTLLLAKTNLIICGNTSTASGFGLLVGNGTSTSAGANVSSGDLQLGQENVIQAFITRVGGARSLLGTMEFQPGLVSPALIWRGIDGFSPADTITIGDNSALTADADIPATSTGRVDLVSGTVDISVNDLLVGRNAGGTSTTLGAGGDGTLSWSAGTISCLSTLDIGRQNNNNIGNSRGVVNVLTNAVLQALNIRIGNDAGANSGTGNGTLNIAYGGQATAAGNIWESSTTTTGTSTINVTNGALTVGGLVRVDNLTAASSVLNLVITPTINNANPVCDVTNLTLLTSVTINVSGSGVTLASYPLIKYKGSIGGGGFGVVALGTQPADTFGYLFDNTANHSIDLVVTNVPAAKWDGTVNGDWDIATTTNWINSVSSAAVAYQQTTIPGDLVLFDDTATGTKTVNLTTTLSPAMVIVNTTNTYTFSGAGWISGPGGLAKSGSGTLEIANSGVNDYSGPTLVAGGRLLANGTIAGVGAMTVQSGATLGGSGTIFAPVTIASAATLAPGASIGTLTFNNSLLLSAGSSNVFEVDTDTLAHDLVAGFGGVTYGGTLVLSLSGGNTAITNGAEIQLFSPAGSGSFAAIEPAYPALGFYWDTNTLAADGTLRIQAIPPGTTVTWTNVAGGNLLWSNPANWVRTTDGYPGSLALNSVPTADDKVYFLTTNRGAFAATNVVGAVNNIVDADITVGPMLYTAQEPGYHTMQINAGATLSVTNPFATTGDPFSYRASRDESSITGYVTIKGVGRLVVGDTNFPHASAANQIRIHAVASPLVPGQNPGANTNGPFMATMDMSDLDYFASATGEMKIGASATSGRGTRGTLMLAKTNLVIAGATSDNFYGLIIGGATGGDYQPGGSIGHLWLGQENDIRANSMRVGGPRAQLGTLQFRAGLNNPTLKMRNVDGVSPMNLISIGDNYQTGSAGAVTSTTETSTGNLDLTGGTVDILVASLRVGRNLNSSTTGNNGSGNGTLTWTAGTIQSTGTTDLGRQNGNNRGNSTGVVNVCSNAVWLGDDIRIGSDAGSATGTGSGTLNIVYGGQVAMINGLTEHIIGAGTSTINVTNGYLSVGGVVTVDNVNAISGVISNVGLMTASTLTGNGTIGGPVTVLTSLEPGASLGTLTIFNDLILTNTSTSTMEVDLDTLACDKVVGVNNLTLDGTLVVTNVGGATSATNGATLQLFSAANYLGAFTAANLPVLGGGLGWDTSGLANGTLKIVTAVSMVPTNVSYSLTGGTLSLSWPGSHLGWYAQSNAVGVASPGSWYDIPGSQSGTNLDITILPGQPNVFFRLRSP